MPTKSAILLLLVTVTALQLLVAALPAHGGEGQSGRVLRVGGLFALTGPGAQFSLDTQQGIQLAIPELERKHSIRIELLAQDTRMETGPSVTAFKHLKTNEDIRYFVVLGSGPVLAIKSLIGQEPVFISTSAAHQDILKDTTSIVRHSNHSREDARQLAAYVADRLNVKRVLILTLENEWSVDYSNELKKNFDKAGIAARESSFAAEQSDFRSLLIKAKSTSSEAIVLVSFGPSLLRLMRTAKELHIDLPLVVNIGFAITEGSRQLAEELQLANFHYQDTPEIPGTFRESFRSRFNREPAGYWAVSAYTDMELLVDAFIKSSGNPAGATSYVRGLGKFQGTFEAVQISPEGEILLPTRMTAR